MALNCQLVALDVKNAENLPQSKLIYDGRNFWRQCVNVIDTMWGRIYFSSCKHFGFCAMDFTLKKNGVETISTQKLLEHFKINKRETASNTEPSGRKTKIVFSCKNHYNNLSFIYSFNIFYTFWLTDEFILPSKHPRQQQSPPPPHTPILTISFNPKWLIAHTMFEL